MITTFSDIPTDTTFQIVYEVPGPAPTLPPQTVFTKIAPIPMPLGTANAIYASDDATQHNAVSIPDDCTVRPVRAPILTVAESALPPDPALCEDWDARAAAMGNQTCRPARRSLVWLLPINGLLLLIIVLAWR